jgi:ADP-ribose pyrophosphatase YjhB (NUDIX family)
MLTKKKRPQWLRFVRALYYFFERPYKKLYFWVARPETTGVKLFIFNEDRLLLVRLGYAHKKWVLPGGKVDRGELLDQAARRELNEESGVIAGNLKLLGSLYNEHQYKKNTVHYFYGAVTEEDLVVDDQEIVDAGWYKLDALPGKCAPRLYKEITQCNSWRSN